MLHESLTCSAPGTPQHWCDRQLLWPRHVVSAFQCSLVTVISSFTMFTRLRSSGNDKLMYVTLVGFSVADLMLNAHVILSSYKEYVFNAHIIPKLSGGKYTWCNVAATIQMFGLFGYIFFIPCIGLAFMKGMSFRPHWYLHDVKRIIMSIMAITVTLALIITITMTQLGIVHGSLTDACSYMVLQSRDMQTILIMPTIIFLSLTVICIAVTITFYVIAINRLKDSQKQVRQMQTMASDRRMVVMVVIKHFVCNVLFLLFALLLSSITAILMASSIQITAQEQIHITFHVVPILAHVNSYIFLIRNLIAVVCK